MSRNIHPGNVSPDRRRLVNVKIITVSAIAAAGMLLTASGVPAAVRLVHAASPPAMHPARGVMFTRPWVEGYNPTLENQLFDATYRAIPYHNVLKIYMYDVAGFESGAIRFSARVPHEQRDLSLAELDRETAALIRTTFDQFPSVAALDIWATIPVPVSKALSIENTVYSVSADRQTYARLRGQPAPPGPGPSSPVRTPVGAAARATG